MKPFYSCLIVFSLMKVDCYAFSTYQEEPQFVVLVASYNNKRWFRNNLDSIFEQDYPYFRVIYIDDNSQDETGEAVLEYVKEKKFEKRFKLIRNKNRRLKVANFYRTIHEECLDNEVVVELDGDDRFFDNTALSVLARYYRNPKIWMTYGQYIEDGMFRRFRLGKLNSVRSSKAKAVPQKVIEENLFRKHRWVTMHLRTYRAWLFKAIKLEDLLVDNHFYSVAGDLAMTFPMLEMAGQHSCFVPNILYVYNNHSPLNDFRTKPVQQMYTEICIRLKDPYKPLKEPRLNLIEKWSLAKANIILVASDSNTGKIKMIANYLMHHNKSLEALTVICPPGYNELSELEKSGCCVKCVDISQLWLVKEAIVESLGESNYVILMNESGYACQDNLDVTRSIIELERTRTHCVLLHAHKNEIPKDQLAEVFHGVYVWNLKHFVRADYFAEPYMILYRVKDLRRIIKMSQSIDGNASTVSDGKRFGLIIDK